MEREEKAVVKLSVVSGEREWKKGKSHSDSSDPSDVVGSNVIAQYRKHGRAKINKSVSVVLSLWSNEIAKYRCLLGINVFMQSKTMPL